MKKFLVAMGLVAFAVVGCDDSSSASAGPNDEPGVESSSSSNGKVTEPVEVTSSSSGSAGKVNCSTLLEGETGWSWDVPKECRFNPNIDYGFMTDSRDGHVYRTVTIGDKVWMAENLNYADSVKTPSLLKRNWCYEYDPKNCDVAGRLYTWAAAIDSAKLYTVLSLDCGYGKFCTLPDTVYGICPAGWHLPSNEDWIALITTVGDASNAGKVLKSQNGWNSYGNGTDAFGFSALPAGVRVGVTDFFVGQGGSVNFWSSAESDADSVYAYYMVLKVGDDGTGLGADVKFYGYYIRCVKD